MAKKTAEEGNEDRGNEGEANEGEAAGAEAQKRRSASRRSAPKSKAARSKVAARAKATRKAVPAKKQSTLASVGNIARGMAAIAVATIAKRLPWSKNENDPIELLEDRSPPLREAARGW